MISYVLGLILVFVVDTASQCGRSLSNRPRISGGVNVMPQQWSWMVCSFNHKTASQR